MFILPNCFPARPRFRGASVIERDVDASDPGRPDFAESTTADWYGNGLPDRDETLDAYSRIRTVSTKRFGP